MRAVAVETAWPESWRRSYQYDRLELYGHEPGSPYVHAYRERSRHTLELVRAAAPPGARVLDVAAAQGNFTLALAEMGYAVTWNDLRADLADYVRRKYERGRVEYAAGDVFALDVAPFDVVLAAEVIEHVAHPDRFLAAIARLVKPGGSVVLTTPNGAYFRNPLPCFSDCADPSVFEREQFKPDADGHIFLLRPEETMRLARAVGLELIETRLFCTPLTHGYLKLAPVVARLPERLVRRLERASEWLPARMQRRLMTSMAMRLCRRGSG